MADVEHQTDASVVRYAGVGIVSCGSGIILWSTITNFGA